MYNITRNEASKILNVSTRSIDRYIKSWKLRTEKRWKIIYINDQDINNIKKWDKTKQHIIINNKIEDKTNENKVIVNDKKEDYIYKELINTIKEKDKKIEKLIIELSNSKQLLQNSISLIDYKKNQYLLEQKEKNIKIELEKEINKKEIQIYKEKNMNKLLIFISFILLITTILVWFSNI